MNNQVVHMNQYASRALSIFASYGIPITEKQKTILCELGAAEQIFEAESVYIKMRNAGISVCHGTVRNVISLLLRFNLLVKVDNGSRKGRFVRIVVEGELKLKAIISKTRTFTNSRQLKKPNSTMLLKLSNSTGSD